MYASHRRSQRVVHHPMLFQHGLSGKFSMHDYSIKMLAVAFDMHFTTGQSGRDSALDLLGINVHSYAFRSNDAYFNPTFSICCETLLNKPTFRHK